MSWVVTGLVIAFLLALLSTTRRGLPSWIGSLGRPSARAIKLVCVEDLPEAPQSGVLYVAGEGPNAWAAAMLCPCGCKEVIQLNLLQQVRPRWRAWQDSDGSANLSPSVWRQQGCRSHFFLRQGRIDWCRSSEDLNADSA